MRSRPPFLLLLLLAPLFGLACASGGGPASELPAEDTVGILAAVYRYQLAHDVRPNTEALCLCAPGDSREGADPSSDLLRRFAGEAKPVLTCSACTVEEARVIEKKGGKSALTLYVASFRPLLSGEVEVEGGVRAGRFSSTHLRYRVVRQGKDWTVTDALGPQVP